MKHTSIIMTLLLVCVAAPIANSADAQVVFARKSGPQGYMGIRYDEEYEQRNDQSMQRVIVRDVSKDSPAEKAGIKAGDEIIRINGLAAGNGKFTAIAGTLAEGDTVHLRLKREGKERNVTLVAAARPAGMLSGSREYVVSADSVRRLMRVFIDSARFHLDSLRLPRIRVAPGDSSFDIRIERFRGMPGDSLMWRGDSAMGRAFRMMPGDGLLPREWRFERELGPDVILHSMELGRSSISGAEFTPMEPGLAEYFGNQRGLLTLRVAPETPADRAGLQSGDVVLKANGRVVQRISDLRAIVAGNPEGVKLDIMRKGQARSIDLKTRR